MALECGNSGTPGGIPEADLRELWELHRGELMASNTHPGSRPWAWWIFDSPLGKCPLKQVTALAELGELTERDVERLRAMPGTSYWPPEAEAAWLASFPREVANA